MEGGGDSFLLPSWFSEFLLLGGLSDLLLLLGLGEWEWVLRWVFLHLLPNLQCPFAWYSHILILSVLSFFSIYSFASLSDFCSSLFALSTSLGLPLIAMRHIGSLSLVLSTKVTPVCSSISSSPVLRLLITYFATF